ncbi:MAG: DUF2778 domain-containing protein [Cereibacter sphaeroides]|uniref:DUF2778 domain-containing protein n=1 Tax=Cereibacter sphaeroides TaxID=1063 RepID=A0A2W5RV83_CERSP|nr:MAG: DUF2778 domain-containing protein [Cereibacter sphaeroides]
MGTGYAGKGKGRNNVASECVRNVGPLPRANYRVGSERGHPTRLTFPLEPIRTADREAQCGRSGFLIHGDNEANAASEGCIVLGPDLRRQFRTGDIVSVI